MSLYSINDAQNVLGCLLNNPLLLLDDKYKLDKYDFKPNALHHIIFISISNLVSQGAKEISGFEIDQYLQNFKPQAEMFNDNNGLEFCKVISELNSSDNIDVFYNNVKKFSVLRRYKENGFDITKFYDESKSESDELSKLASVSIEDIITYFDKIQSDIKKVYYINKEKTEMICGTDGEELLEELKADPMIGAQICSPMLTSIYRGWNRGHLLLRGAPSSFGKTCLGIADELECTAKKIWNEEKHDFIDNPYYQSKGAYIHSEQKSREEIQTRVLSNLTKIPYNKILDGDFTKDEEDRFLEGCDILKDSEFKLINYPNFTGNGLKAQLLDLALDGYFYVNHDYIWDNFYIGAELRQMSGTPIRQDMALLHIVDVLKLSAERNDQAIMTSMQTNGNEKINEIIDEACLLGSKSVKTKLDCGEICMSPRRKELDIVTKLGLIDTFNKKHHTFGTRIEPNCIHHCFKTRYGKYGQNIKVWQYYDSSTGSVLDMFATTCDNKPLNVESLYIKSKNNT